MIVCVHHYKAFRLLFDSMYVVDSHGKNSALLLCCHALIVLTSWCFHFQTKWKSLSVSLACVKHVEVWSMMGYQNDVFHTLQSVVVGIACVDVAAWLCGGAFVCVSNSCEIWWSLYFIIYSIFIHLCSYFIQNILEKSRIKVKWVILPIESVCNIELCSRSIITIWNTRNSWNSNRMRRNKAERCSSQVLAASAEYVE